MRNKTSSGVAVFCASMWGTVGCELKPGHTGNHKSGNAYWTTSSYDMAARLDADRTATPETRLVAHVDASKCVNPAVSADMHVDNETGKRTPLRESPEMTVHLDKTDLKLLAELKAAIGARTTEAVIKAALRAFKRQHEERPRTILRSTEKE